jgi:hypothetical protein
VRQPHPEVYRWEKTFSRLQKGPRLCFQIGAGENPQRAHLRGRYGTHAIVDRKSPMILLAKIGTRPRESEFYRKGSPLRDAAEEDRIVRKFIECREYPTETNCTVAPSADSDEERSRQSKLVSR